jgi:poly-gamma-glutamate capsule biosynthesis protein CapA/YwtB (metallophosphatase superfamily)
MKPVNFIIGGDLAPTESNYTVFSQGSMEALLDAKLMQLLRSADYRIFNLEVPLTDISTPISKDGPNLIAPPSVINGIRSLAPAIFGLANNHILDHDEQGILKTMEQLSENGLRYVGAGKNLKEASIPVIIEEEGVKIGIYACAENEFSIAEENTAGANPFDPLESLDHISNLKSVADFVIVLHHGGKEHYRYPSPALQKVCRKMVDKGADLIVCQHSHCIGAYEKYSGSTIVYGQGNFLFDRWSNEFWNSGLLLKATFGTEMSIEFIPVSKNGNGVTLAEQGTGEKILADFMKRSEEITNPGFINSRYEKYCSEKGLFYLQSVAGIGRIPGKIDRIFKGIYTNLLFSKTKLNMLQNFIECETNRELLLKFISIKRKGK